MDIAVLTSPDQWFEPYAEELSGKLGNVPIYKDHEKIDGPFDVLFILSYHRVLNETILRKNKRNIVIHASQLPQGKGWAPLSWQILEGKNSIVFSMFEANESVDAGDIYMTRTLQLKGHELSTEIRREQALLSIEMCQEFVENSDRYLPPKKQTGIETYYRKRTAADSLIDPRKTI